MTINKHTKTPTPETIIVLKLIQSVLFVSTSACTSFLLYTFEPTTIDYLFVDTIKR